MIAISARERMAMVENGYNPLIDQDVINFRKGVKPQVGVKHFVEGNGEFSFNSLGEKHMTSIQDQYYDEDFTSSVAEEIKAEVPEFFAQSKVSNSREGLKNSMDNYKSKPVDLNAKLQSVIQNKIAPQAVKKEGVTLDVAKKAGYSSGAKYLNAFHSLIKSPSEQNRNFLLEKIGEMLQEEEKYKNSTGYKSFQAGLADAEAKLYKLLIEKRK